jgi:uncharacterized protein YndB with AHSA1/START domain
MSATAPATPEFVVTRAFDAPREVVWKSWTQAERLAQWWGPKGCAIRVVKLDLRPGGIFHYAMRLQPGHEMFGRFVYREIAAPQRLEFINSFSDPAAGMARAPFSQTWPLEVHNTLTLTEQGEKTELALRGRPINATDEKHKTFVGMFDSLRQGFTGTFDQLADHVAKARENRAGSQMAS